ncbi:hypothetical protein C8D03_0961 [Bosea sp. 124]|nr:hypothetical protein C8D03_0961 [Bosea sp. 124]
MPFSSLRDPSDLARAYAALEAAWREIKNSVPEAQRENARLDLAYLVADLAPLALDEDDLRENVLHHFRQRTAVHVT